jgi:hypothetical protein
MSGNWRLFAVRAFDLPTSNTLMRTPNATEHHLSYDNEFLPGGPA